MNEPIQATIFGYCFNRDRLKYSYTSKQMRFKKFLIYPIIILIAFWITQEIIMNHIITGILTDEGWITDEIYADKLLEIEYWRGIFRNSMIIVAISFIILLLPRVFCVFLKVEGKEKDILLYKTIHKGKARHIAEEINELIKNNTLTSYP